MPQCSAANHARYYSSWRWRTFSISSSFSNDEAQPLVVKPPLTHYHVQLPSSAAVTTAASADTTTATDRMAFLNTAVHVVTALCAAWYGLYLCYGATSSGSAWYTHLVTTQWYAAPWADAPKAGVPIVTLVSPILLAATVGVTLFRRPPSPWSSPSTSPRSVIPTAFFHRFPSGYCHRNAVETAVRRCVAILTRLGTWTSRLWRKPSSSANEMDMNRVALVFLALPLLVYLLTGLRNKLADRDNQTTDWIIMECANRFAFTALAALAVLLIPVTRHGILLPVLLGQSFHPIDVVTLHIWLGRIVVLASLVHGVGHMLRWILAGEQLMRMILPPAVCWRRTETDPDENTYDSAPTCHNKLTECSCYDLWRNCTGMVAAVGLVVIAISSVPPVRRTMFATFYYCHLVAAPIVLVAVIVHWERSILYIAGGMLYYLATTLPTLAETFQMDVAGMGQCHRDRSSMTTEEMGPDSVRVLFVEEIPVTNHIVNTRPVENAGGVSSEETRDSNGGQTQLLPQGTCIAVTIAASTTALERFHAGSYVKVRVPALSAIGSHPFTINAVIGPNGVPLHPSLRIIFRTHGPFTSNLAQKLLSQQQQRERVLSTSLTLYMEGFYGPVSDRVTQALSHRHILVICGGIGITPYLSWLYNLARAAACAGHSNRVGDEFDDGDLSYGSEEMDTNLERRPKPAWKVRLHWMCRDPALIAYVKREYWDHVEVVLRDSDQGNAVDVKIVVHDTFTGQSPERPDSVDSMMAPTFSDVQSPGVYDEHPLAVENNEDAAGIISSSGRSFAPAVFAPGTKISLRGNVPAAVVSCVVFWGGLCVVWQFYQIFVESNTIGSRLYAPLAMLMLGALTAVIANSLVARYWDDSDSRNSSWIPLGMSGTTRHDDTNVEMIESPAGEDDTNTTSSSETPVHSIAYDSRPSHCRFAYVVEQGRPDVCQLITESRDQASIIMGRDRVSFDDSLGVFICGPETLTKSVNDGLRATEMLANVSVYRETFNL